MNRLLTRTALITAAVVALAALLLLLGPPWLRLAVLVALAGRGTWSRRQGVWRWAVARRWDLICCGALVGLTFVMLLPASIGDRPVSYDHTIHYTKAWQLSQMLGAGRLWGWCEHWMAGYPTGFNYPLGGDLWVNLVHLLLLGFGDLSAAYGVAMWWLYAGLALSIYAVGAEYFSRPVGLAAALLLVLEQGAVTIGGWQWIMVWGVWPSALSVALALLGLSRLGRLRSDRPVALRAMVKLALLWGAAIVAHPLQLIHLAVLAPVSMGLFLLSAPPRVALMQCLRLAGAMGAAVMLAAWWLLPFISAGPDQVRESLLWQTWQQMGQNLAAGKVIPQLWTYVTVLGMVGSLALLVTNRFRTLLTSVPLFVLLVTGAASFYTTFGLRRISESFSYIHYPRFAMLVQPYLCLGAAFVLQRVFAGLPAEGGRFSFRQLGWRRPLRLALVFCLTLPVLAPASWALIDGRVLQRIDTHQQRSGRESRQALVRWLRQRRREDPRFWRFALDRSLGNLHHHVDLVTQVEVPLYKEGHTPAVQFINRSERLNDATMRALNIRYVVGKSPRPARSTLKQVAAVGFWTVFEYSGWTPRIFEISRGAAAVRLLRRSENEVALQLGPGARGKLRLNVADFSRWRAYRDGQPMAITPVRISGVQFQFIAVDVTAPGTYVFRYEASTEEWIGAVVSLLGLCMVLAFVILGRNNLKADGGVGMKE